MWRRRMRARDVECDLGPVIGQIAPPMRVPYRRTPMHEGWIERGLPKVLGFIAISALGAILALGALLANVSAMFKGL